MKYFLRIKLITIILREYIAKASNFLKMSSIKNISLFIPRVSAEYSERDIYNIIDNEGYGKLKKIDLANYRISSDGITQICSAYIHFEYWYDTIYNRNFQSRISDTSSDTYIYINNYSYWIVLENKARKYSPFERKPRIVIDKPTEVTKPINVSNKKYTKPEQFTEEEIYYIQKIADKELDDIAETYRQMDDLALYMEEADNENLITIDGRYVKSLEEQVLEYQNEVTDLREILYQS